MRVYKNRHPLIAKHLSYLKLKQHQKKARTQLLISIHIYRF